MTKVFIDGSAGTTGLRIHERLADRKELEILSLPPELRKDKTAREEILNAADVAFLCLPDAAAIEAADLVHGDTAVIDTSTAHRTEPGWDYGFPELHGLREKIAVMNLTSIQKDLKIKIVDNDLGRLISGFISERLGDRTLIRLGIAVEGIGILMVFLPVQGYLPAAAGFAVIGTGMGPVYPSIQHMAPENFGRRHSAAAIGLQMASAYVGSTLMPMAFGHLQLAAGIRIMPFYLLLFAGMNLLLLELAYRQIRSRR